MQYASLLHHHLRQKVKTNIHELSAWPSTCGSSLMRAEPLVVSLREGLTRTVGLASSASESDSGLSESDELSPLDIGPAKARFISMNGPWPVASSASMFAPSSQPAASLVLSASASFGRKDLAWARAELLTWKVFGGPLDWTRERMWSSREIVSLLKRSFECLLAHFFTLSFKLASPRHDISEARVTCLSV